MSRERIIRDGKVIGYRRLAATDDAGQLSPSGEPMTPVYSDAYPDRVIRWEPGPKAAKKIAAELERKLANVSLVPSDFIRRVDFYDEVRRQEAKGVTLDIKATIAKYRALDDKPGAIADDNLARVRALQRETVNALWDNTEAAEFYD
jgi:hypothetical protein